MANFFDTIEDRVAFQTLLENNKGVIILKFGAEWCQPCKVIAPKVNEYKDQLPEGVDFYDLDVDDNFEIYAYLKSKKMVTGIPTLLAYYAGNTLFASDDSFSGVNVEELKIFFEKILSQKCLSK